MSMKRIDSATSPMSPPISRVVPARALTSGPAGGAIAEAAAGWEVLELRRRVHAGMWSVRLALVLSVPFAMTAWATGADHAWFMYMLLPLVAARSSLSPPTSFTRAKSQP